MSQGKGRGAQNAKGKRKAGKAATSKADPKTREKQAEALDYRKQGYSYHAIAESMGISVAYAHKLVITALAEVVQEPATDLIRMQIERCQDMLATFFPSAIKGDDKASATVLSLIRQIDAYHGIGASTQSKGGKATVTLPGGAPGQETTKLEIEFV